MRTFNVLGTRLLATTYKDLTGFCQQLLQPRRVTAVDLTNTQIVTMRRHDPRFRAITNHFDFFIPDGMPLIWCMNRQSAQLSDRVYGPTFMRQFIVNTPTSFTHYFLGGSEQCLARLHQNFRGLNPNVQIIGSHHGYFGVGDEETIIGEINRLAPDFIWIGLGTPKQQEWIHRNKARILRGVLFAVGFAFDVNAGLKRDAPAVMQRVGLTWLFRVLTEPRRLFSRYLRYNTLFIFYLLKDKFTSRPTEA